MQSLAGIPLTRLRVGGNISHNVTISGLALYGPVYGVGVLADRQGDRRGNPARQGAGDGEKVVETLSKQLTKRYGQGFSEQSLQNFRRFYLAYPERIRIPSPMGRESSIALISSPTGRELIGTANSYPTGSESLQCFSPQLSWSHYRALMRIENSEVRDFYERETIAGGWDKRTLSEATQKEHGHK